MLPYIPSVGVDVFDISLQ